MRDFHMEPDKLSALLQGQLSQQDYLSSQNEILANPTQSVVPDLGVKQEMEPESSTMSGSAETNDMEDELDAESDDGSEEGSTDSDDDDDDTDDEEDEDDDDYEDESGSESDEGEEEESVESVADDDSKSGESLKADVDVKVDADVKADVVVKVENGADNKSGEEVIKLEENREKPGLIEELSAIGEELVPANGDISVEEQMDFKDDFDVKSEGGLISGEIVPTEKPFECDPDLMSAISDPKFGEKIAMANCSDSNLKASAPDESTVADGEQPKTGKKKSKDKSMKSGKLKRKRKRAADGSVKSEKKKKKRKKEDGEKKKKKNKARCERKNIRKILKEGDLDEETITAQQEEKERKERLQALQRNVANNMHLKALLETDEEDEEKDDLDVMEKDDKTKRVGKYAAFKPKADVIELSSDEEDDDVTVLETPEEEIESEDPNNSGLHVDDTLNIPDEKGRVLVNVGHPGDEQDIFLAPQIAKVIKPHQIGGIRFLYDNLVESVNRFKTSHGFGCILAHSMGLGKTIQMVSFIDIFLRNTEARNVLVIVPINTLQNWLAEFSMWVPESHNVKETMKDEVWPREFSVHLINDNQKTTKARAAVIQLWLKTGGVLLMGYEMYRLLATRKATKAKRKPGRKSGMPLVIDLEEEDRNNELALDIQTALLRPGPDLVICDEGHRIKNSHASISQALKNIRTRRRVVLTGYPLQNNMIEYWCMVDFVRPNYLGNKAEFCNMFERPIMNGQCMDSTPQDARLMRHRAHVLHSLLEGFVQRRGHAVLKDALPTKVEHVLFVRMSPVQRKLYRLFMDSLTEMALSGWATVNPLKAFSVCCKIWNHPDILYNIVKQMSRTAIEDDLDLGETADGKDGVKKPRGRKKKTRTPPTPVIDPVTGRPFPDTAMSLFPDRRMETITYEWANDVMTTYNPGTLKNGGKMDILFNIIRETIEAGEKLLVFSQSLFTLNLMEEFLGKTNVPKTEDKWAKNKYYFRLDGSTSSQEREKLINLFNAPDNDNVHLFLLSTRAGCLGINLVGASRVVVFDASWNPCHDCQAVCRIYRYGQTKPCYIYRLVTDNTLEKKIYERQINKQGMADRVVDEMNPQNNYTKRQVESLLHYEDQDLPQMNLDCIDDLTDPVIRTVLSDNAMWLTKDPFTHESLLIDQQELRLSKAEKKLARQSYEREKKMNVSSYQRPSYQAYYPKAGEMAGASNSYRSGMTRNLSLATSLPNPGGSLAPPQSMASPVPMTLKSASSGFGKGLDLSTGHSMNHSGVTVNQVITTTEIVVPATTTSTDTTPQIKIPPGKQILVIKTQKGVYIRTPEGKIFAVRGGGSTRTVTAPKPNISVTAATSTMSTSTVTTATNSADSMSSYDSRPSGSPRVPACVSDLMDGSSQDSISSSTTGGMTGLLRSALMKGRQEVSGRPPSQMSTTSNPSSSVQTSVAPSPLTAQFTSLSTSSHHASPVPFTQGSPMSRQSSHHASPVPYTQSHSRFGASPMESLVSMASNKPLNNQIEESEKSWQESDRSSSASGMDYQSPTYPGSSHRLATTTTNSFVEPKLSTQMSSNIMPKKLTDPYEVPQSSTSAKPDSGFSMADLLRDNKRKSSKSTLDHLMKPGFDKTMEDYDSAGSSGMSDSFPEIDFNTPMPSVEQALPPSQLSNLGMASNQSQPNRQPMTRQMPQSLPVYSAPGRGLTTPLSDSTNRNDPAAMSSLGSLLGTSRSRITDREVSAGTPLSIADYQRAFKQTSALSGARPNLGGGLVSSGGSRMSSMVSMLPKSPDEYDDDDDDEDDEETSGPPLSIADYQRALSQSETASKPTASRDSYRKDEMLKMSSQGSYHGKETPGSNETDEGGSSLSIADYQRAFSQTGSNAAAKPTVSGGNFNRKEEFRPMSFSPQYDDEEEEDEDDMEDSGPPLSIADYQRLLSMTEGGAEPAGGNNYTKEPGKPSGGSQHLDQSPSPSPPGMPLSIADYQRALARPPSDAGPKVTQRGDGMSPSPGAMKDSSGMAMGIADHQRVLVRPPSNVGPKVTHGGDVMRKQEPGMSSLGSLLGNESPDSESMEDSGPPLSIADYQRLLARTVSTSGPKPAVGSESKQATGISAPGSMLETRSPESELKEEDGPPLSIADYQRALSRSASNPGVLPTATADSIRKPESGMPPVSRTASNSGIMHTVSGMSPVSQTASNPGVMPTVPADSTRKPETGMPPDRRTAGNHGLNHTVTTDSNRKLEGGMSLLGQTVGYSGVNPTDYNRKSESEMSSLGRTASNLGINPTIMADSNRKPESGMSSLGTLLGQSGPNADSSYKGIEAPRPYPGITAPSQRTFYQTSSDAASRLPGGVGAYRSDGPGIPSLSNLSPMSGGLEESGQPLSIADYQLALTRTTKSNQVNRNVDSISHIGPPGPVQGLTEMSTTAGQVNMPMQVPLPAKKPGKKRGPKPKPKSDTKPTQKRGRKKATKKTEPAFGGQMGLQGPQPIMSPAQMNMGISHPYRGNQPGLARSVSDSPQVGVNYGPRPMGREPGSGMSFGMEGSRNQNNMNMPSVSRSPSLDRLFDSDSNSGLDQNAGLMMDFLGNKGNSRIDQDTRGASLGQGNMPTSSHSSHLNMTSGGHDTAMGSPMDMGNSRNFSNSRQENYEMLQRLYQTDSLSKPSDLFPGEETMQNNELAHFLSKGNMVSASSNIRPSNDFSGLSSSPSMTTQSTSSNMSMGSPMVQDSSGGLSSMFREDSRNRLPGVGTDSSGKYSNYMGIESGGRLQDSSGRITSSDAGASNSGLAAMGMGLSHGADAGGNLPGMGNFSRGLGDSGLSRMMNNYGMGSEGNGLSGSSSDSLSRLGDMSGQHNLSDSGNRYSRMDDSNNRLVGYQDSASRVGTSETNSRHSGLGDSVYSQSQSDFSPNQSYMDQMTARSSGQEFSNMSSQSQSNSATLPSFNSSYMPSSQEMGISQPWMGYPSSYGLQDTGMYGVQQGAPQQEGMNWSGYSHFQNQTSQGNTQQTLMSSSQEKKN